MQASRFSPWYPAANTSTSSGAASTPASTSSDTISASMLATAPATRRASSSRFSSISRTYTGMNDADSTPSPNRFCSRFGNFMA
jgi:hypothetical protein